MSSMNKLKDYIYDLETFKNIFTFSIVRSDGKHKKTFECSRRVNQIDGIMKCIDYLKDNDCRMVGFNNIGFDYPILHKLLSKSKLPKSGEVGSMYYCNKTHRLYNLYSYLNGEI